LGRLGLALLLRGHAIAHGFLFLFTVFSVVLDNVQLFFAVLCVVFFGVGAKLAQRVLVWVEAFRAPVASHIPSAFLEVRSAHPLLFFALDLNLQPRLGRGPFPDNLLAFLIPSFV